MSKKLVFYVLLSSITGSIFAQKLPESTFKDGDFLFQDIRCGDLCNAIETVTQGWKDKKFSHLGLVCHRNDSMMVAEAIGTAVRLTPVTTFLARSKDSAGNPRIVLGRLKKQYAHLNAGAIAYTKTKLGMPYDNDFLYNNGKYYCSELIYDAYKFANGGKPFFQLQPMTFKDPAKTAFFPVWVKYYEDLKMKIPEGEPGCNPGGLANSNKIEIIKSFY